MAVAAPLVTAAGALAPTFPFLVATQAIGRPLGLALDFLVAVVAAEEMPRNSRAYAVSVLAMASGLGAGVAVMALPLADISARRRGASSTSSSLVWLLVAVDIARRLPETERFERPHVIAPPTRPPPVRRARPSSPCSANLFVAPASLFQNGYLEDDARLLGDDDRHLHAGDGDAGRHRADHRRAHRRRPRPARADRRRRAGRRPPCVVLSYSVGGPADVVGGVRSPGCSAGSPTRRSPSTAPSCSRPATAAGPPA